MSTVTEALKSLDAFRQYGRIAELLQDVDARIDASSRAHHLRFVLSGWNAAILGSAGAVLMLVGALISVSQRHTIEPARIGLTLGALLTAFRGLVRRTAWGSTDRAAIHYASGGRGRRCGASDLSRARLT